MQPGRCVRARKSLLHFIRVSDQKVSSMSVIMFSASARQNLQSRTGSVNAELAAIDEGAAGLQALSASRLIAASALPLAGQMHARLLRLMR
ncbi:MULTISPECIES: hypothetical protein [unclassified Bradyrhizobium]|uniref:hypothetical protein n=1 Tax=unclassified Bradyrhizobium TaxID=2631580 RepID=UPI0028EA699E|nr:MULTISPECIES: hypothetical protein [unclassified Bradyrhizobium]